MKKTTFIKSLLLAAALTVGASAWAETTIGSTTSGWGDACTSAYTLPTGKTLTFTFTVDESAGDYDYQGYVAILAKTNANTWGANQYLFLRSQCDYNIGGGDWNVGALYNTNTYGETSKVAFFTGATVNMAIKRVGTDVMINTAITKAGTTYYHYYQQNLGTEDDIYAFLAADKAKLTITGDAITDNGLTKEEYDFVTPAKGIAGNVSSTSISSLKVNGTDCGILKNTRIDMHDRFAGQNSGEWLIQRNNSLYLSSGGDRKLGILKLHAGDIVTLTFSDVTPTFSGTPNAFIAADGDLIAGTSLISGAAYTIKADGQLNLNTARYIHIKNITIHTAFPVLNTPTISFNSMVENSGLYYPNVSFSSDEDGVTYVDGSNNSITDSYTFTGAGNLSVYAVKDGRTKSAEVRFEVPNGWILANSVDCYSLKGNSNYADGSVLGNGSNVSSATWAIPGVSLGTSMYYYWYSDALNGSFIRPTSGDRTVSCSVLNENRVATFYHYYYESNKTVYDYLTSTNNSATFHRNGNNYDNLYQYALYVSPSEIVSATIGSTGYSTFSSPVPLNFAGIEGLKAYVAKSVADGTVTLTPVETAPANTGLVLKGTAGETYTIPVTSSAVAPESNLLVGCIVEMTVAKDETSKFNNYVLVIEDDEAKFQSLVDNGATIPAGKAFLKNGAYSAAAGTRLSIKFSDESTGISFVENADMQNAQYYNLNGQRTLAPQKGLYIVNGKKVVLK
jgi:hypothetical protein